ncbi:ABC transporter, partial [Rhodococcus hoagii]|nr:ABC transporter [Prescottella equi]
STLQDALEALLVQASASAAVTGRRGEYAGIVTIDTLVHALQEVREEHADDHVTGELSE